MVYYIKISSDLLELVEMLSIVDIVILQLGIESIPVLVGPVSYLLLSKPAKGIEKSFSLLSLVESILPVYK